MTIRRDLEELAAHGVLRRVHGGAVGAPPRGEHIPYSVRLGTRQAEKLAIARTCADLIPDGASVIIDAGTTCAAVAHEVAGRDITVLPLSIHAAAAVGRIDGTRIVTPSGPLDPQELSWTGARAVQDIEAFQADITVLGTCGWDVERGITSRNSEIAARDRAAIASAVRVIAVTTPEKFETTATFTVCPTTAIDTLVTTAEIGEVAAELETLGVRIVPATPRTAMR